MKIKALENERLDKYIADKFKEIPRTKVKSFIKKKLIKVNNEIKKPSYKLEENDEIYIDKSLFKKPEIRPQDLNLKIVYQNEDYAVIDKDQDVIVHPAGSIYEWTLVNGLLYEFENLSDLSGKQRPGIVHRLDKDTTGLIIICKNNKAHEFFKEKFKERKVDKTYYAIVRGNFENIRGKIEKKIGRNPNNRKKMGVFDHGKYALSYYEVLDQVDGFSLLKIKIITGRTHQIRAHMEYINHPILGDRLYGNIKTNFSIDYQLLHCGDLSFEDMDGVYKSFHADFHEDFKKYKNILKLGE